MKTQQYEHVIVRRGLSRPLCGAVVVETHRSILMKIMHAAREAASWSHQLLPFSVPLSVSALSAGMLPINGKLDYYSLRGGRPGHKIKSLGVESGYI